MKLDSLWREPNRQHLQLYSRVRSFIKTDGLLQVFDALKVGRRNPELFARLGELTALLTRLGCSSSPYDRVFAGVEVVPDNTIFPELEPYRDLDPQRLRLAGTGHWDVTDFVGDSLVMAYREPASILWPRVPDAWEYPRIRDSAETIAELAKLWDQQGLLLLHRDGVEERQDFEYVRIFNCYKSVYRDRQIGDRRGRNAIECKLQGPSSDLPSAVDVCDLYINVKTHRLFLSITDRRDFYHQLWATRSRAVSNTLGPGLPVELVSETRAYQQYPLRQTKSRRPRIHQGDHLERIAAGEDGLFRTQPGPDASAQPGIAWAAFQSVLHGDHGGVEIATSAHTGLLQHFGLLSPDTMMRASRPTYSTSVNKGLVIDDYFCISIDKKEVSSSESQAYKAYQSAARAYNEYDILGSPEKDIVACESGKVIGAFRERQ